MGFLCLTPACLNEKFFETSFCITSSVKRSFFRRCLADFGGIKSFFRAKRGKRFKPRKAESKEKTEQLEVLKGRLIRISKLSYKKAQVEGSNPSKGSVHYFQKLINRGKA